MRTKSYVFLRRYDIPSSPWCMRSPPLHVELPVEIVHAITPAQRVSLPFCNALYNSVSRIQPLVDLCSACGVAEILQASVLLYFGIPAAVLWVDHVLLHTGIYESAGKSLHGVFIVQISMSYVRRGSYLSPESVQRSVGIPWSLQFSVQQVDVQGFRMDRCLLGW
jgi:hypothetical protein